MAHWFEDRAVAEGYASARPPIHQPILERAVSLLPDGFPRRVGVDVGCGAGASTAPLARVVGLAIGVDPSAAMLAASRTTGVDARFCSGVAEALPFQDSSVDLIIAAGSLDFVDLRTALQEIARVLTPDGNVLVYDYGAARRFRSSDELARWYSTFLDRYPPAVDSRRSVTREALESFPEVLPVRGHQPFDLELVMAPVAYADYLMTQTNVASAVQRGESHAAIRNWCLETLAEFYLSAHPVVFDGYIAHLTRFAGVDGYATPEEAALAGWSSAAGAHIVRVEPCSDASFPGRVWVYVDTEPSHLMRASCELIDGRWIVVSEISD